MKWNFPGTWEFAIVLFNGQLLVGWFCCPRGHQLQGYVQTTNFYLDEFLDAHHANSHTFAALLLLVFSGQP